MAPSKLPDRILSTTAGTDNVLATLNYSLLALLTCLDIYSRRRIEHAALAVAEKASGALLPGETFIAAISEGSYSRIRRTTTRLRALTDRISDVRMFLRLWGLLGIWEWASEMWKNPPRDTIVMSITWAQIFASVMYQSLENGAYLAQHGVVDWPSEKQTRAWIWSSRFWAAHVALDLGRLWRLNSARQQRSVSQSPKSLAAPEDEHVDTEETKDTDIAVTRPHVHGEDDKWWRQLYVNAAYAPLTLHWSLEGGAVSDLWIGILGTSAGLVGLKHLWRENLHH
ncbi:MAG: hypothetical protein M1815_002241 [Lichina confinis]|nr:MAG: hypothetical protein M1815_002241 [Lichina confinis]